MSNRFRCNALVSDVFLKKQWKFLKKGSQYKFGKHLFFQHYFVVYKLHLKKTVVQKFEVKNRFIFSENYNYF